MEAKERILDGAIELFKKDGFKCVTMDALAKSLCVSKRTIYEIFEDKDKLIEACLIEMSAKISKTQLEIINSTTNIYEAMYQFAVNQHKLISEINPLMFEDLNKYYKNILANVKEKQTQSKHNITRQMFQNGIDNGLFSNIINIDIACYLIDDLFDFSIRLIDKDKFKRRDVFSTCFVPFFRGISTDNGIVALAEIEKKIQTFK